MFVHAVFERGDHHVENAAVIRVRNMLSSKCARWAHVVAGRYALQVGDRQEP